MVSTDLVVERDVMWHEGGTVVLRLCGALDAHSIDQLEAHLIQAMNDGCRVLYLDMHGVDYISSAGAGAIINARGLAIERNVELRLATPSICVRQIFKLLGLTEILPFAA